MARAYALLEQPHSDRPRCLVATVVSRQPRELTDADGRLRLDKHLQDQLMRVLELEIDLGVSKQRLKLAPPESCPEHVEEGPLPTLQRQLVLPENARVLGFKYNEALDPATGFVQVHDLCVLLEDAGRLYLEPLSGDACAALTFSKLMWWVDLSLLTLALFYIDVLLDVKQLFLFYSAGLHGYLLLNMIGMVLPIMFTSMEAVKFGRTPSPDQDFVSSFISPIALVPLLVFATVKHPMLSGAKFAEVAESATSALVQTNFLISALGGVSQIEALELSEDQLQSMQLSVAVSCFSLGLGFASRDKADSAVLGLPGKLGWDATMAALVLARSMEVFSRVFAYNILQVSVRGWPLLRFGSLVAVGLVLVSARLLFPDASLADVAASTIAHPGQILEPSSLLPLQNSLFLHGLLVAAAGGSQLLVHISAAPDASKMLPSTLLIAWLVSSSAQLRMWHKRMPSFPCLP
eukprot:s7518_g3.t4